MCVYVYIYIPRMRRLHGHRTLRSQIVSLSLYICIYIYMNK